VTLLLRKNFFLSAVISILICASLVISVKADVVTWHQTYGGAWNDHPSSVVETTDGGFVLAGTLGFSFDEHNTDFWLIKVDAFGNVVWDQTYGGPEYNSVGSMIATSDGGYAIVGSAGSSLTDAWLVKTDSFGNVVWDQTYGGELHDCASSIVEASDGGYVFAGAMEVPPINLDGGFMNAWLVKTDAYGNVEWNKTYGGLWDDVAYSLVATSDGGYAFAGHIGSEHASTALLVKTDATGNMEWNQTFGNGSFKSLVATSDGGYALAGTMNDNFWLVKADLYGNIEWSQTYGTETLDNAYSLVATSDGGYALAGETYSTIIKHSDDFIEYKNADFWLVKTDAFGNMEWNQTYGGTESDRARSLLAASAGGYIVAGTTLSFGAGHSDILLIKTDEYGVAPEAAWVVLPFLLAGTLAVFISKKKLFPKRS
jgi:hypothetical protein